MELGLPGRSTGHGFLEQSRENKRLGHERSEPGKGMPRGIASQEPDNIDTSRKEHLERIRYI